jgi:hypothetical protein
MNPRDKQRYSVRQYFDLNQYKRDACADFERQN